MAFLFLLSALWCLIIDYTVANSRWPHIEVIKRIKPLVRRSSKTSYHSSLSPRSICCETFPVSALNSWHHTHGWTYNMNPPHPQEAVCTCQSRAAARGQQDTLIAHDECFPSNYPALIFPGNRWFTPLRFHPEGSAFPAATYRRIHAVAIISVWYHRFSCVFPFKRTPNRFAFQWSLFAEM